MKKYLTKYIHFTDILFILIIIAIGWLLIGFYLKGEYLHTFYQDWIYHAWRVKSLILYHGMPSWDHIWSNGINHWRSYQYLQHWLVLIVKSLFHLSIPKAMLLTTVIIFIFLRIFMYLFFRMLDIQPIIAFLAVVLSFVYDQQWIAIKDFSIFISFIIIPFYLYLWINIFNKYPLSNKINFKTRRLAEYGLAFISGGLWLLHPVVANALGGLFFISIGFRAIKIHWGYFARVFSFYLLGIIPFILPYLFAGVHYSNPIFSSSIFLRDTIAGNFFGLSGYFLVFVGILWLMILFFSREIAGWAKAIAVYSSLYFLFIYLAQHNYVPAFVIQLQISRVVPVLAILITFAFAGALNGVLLKKGERNVSFITKAIILVIIAIGITEAVKIDTTFTGQPVYRLDDPVSAYFNDKDIPKGSIYVKNVSAASYFSKYGLRFINSYNEHLLPHPLSLRFSSFMRSEIAYTGIPKTQVQLIDDYISALGVEYLVLPETSPLVARLTKNDFGNKSNFKFTANIQTQEGTFSLIRNIRPIHYVYLLDKNDNLTKWSKHILTPTLQVGTYKDWDNSIHSLADKIKNGRIKPFNEIVFLNTNKLFLPVDKISELKNKKILITQSYDPNWKINGHHKGILPSQTRFIILDMKQISQNDLSIYKGQKGILLYNNWPWWHWPVQFTGIITVLVLFILPVIKPKLFFTSKKIEQ